MGKTTVLFVPDAASVGTIEWMLDQCPDFDGSFGAFQEWGLGNLLEERFHPRICPVANPQLAIEIHQASLTADSAIGHAEMMGIINREYLSLFPHGFPEEFIREAERYVGCKFMFNQMAGGTEAIVRNWYEHLNTGKRILYPSLVDPLPQVAAHKNIVTPENLNREAAMLLQFFLTYGPEKDVRINRVIPRSFEGDSPDNHRRMDECREDAIPPISRDTLVELVHKNGIFVAGVGKFFSLVPSSSYDLKIKTIDAFTSGYDWRQADEKDGNPKTFEATVQAIKEAQQSGQEAVILVNLVPTDSVYGHNLVPDGWLKCYAAAGHNINLIKSMLSKGDAIVTIPDHGMQKRRRLDKPNEFYGFHWVNPGAFLGEVIGGGPLEFRGDRWSLTSVGRTLARRHGLEQEYLKMIVAENRYPI